MPIIVDDNNQASIVSLTGAATAVANVTGSPKFFHKRILTGNGNPGSGMLSDAQDPRNHMNGYPSRLNPDLEYGTHYNKDVKIYDLPFFIISPKIWQYVKDFDLPAQSEIVARKPQANGPDEEIRIWIPVHAAQIEEKEEAVVDPNGFGTGMKKTVRKLSASFHMFVFSVKDGATTATKQVAMVNQLAKPGNCFYQEIIESPGAKLATLASDLERLGYFVDNDAMNDYLQNYSLYREICRAAERWQVEADRIVADVMVKNLIAQFPMKNGVVPYIWANGAGGVVGRLEKYNVPLDQYSSMYDKIEAMVPPEILSEICRSNLNLRLTNTLRHMHQNRAALPTCPCAKHVSNPAIPYSTEQIKAIESTSPLTLVQSGAGTGKALPLDEPVLTPSGWRPIGDLKVGDMVIGADGLPHAVVRIHEQGMKPGYRIAFSDGASVRACPEHLWTVCEFRNGRPRFRTLTTMEWIVDDKLRKNAFLPQTDPVQFTEADLPWPAYLVGAILARGSLKNGRTLLSMKDPGAVKAVSEYAASCGYALSGAGKDKYVLSPADGSPDLLATWVMDTLYVDTDSGVEMRIPSAYAFAHEAARRDLASGMFDAMGELHGGAASEYQAARATFLNLSLADDLLQILWSLGLPAVRTVRRKDADGRPVQVSVVLTSGMWNPFRGSALKPKATGQAKPTRRTLVDAVPMAAVPMRCIEIDAPDHLYLAKDYLVTHNSTVILGRIDHMLANGIDPNDITVLSFTNAAADHIRDMKPTIHSMTIASMLHTIYSHNYPTHQLSSEDTIINSLDIYFNAPSIKANLTAAQSKFISDFKLVLTRMKMNGEYTRANNFVEDHFDEVIQTLDTIEQTSLTLEGIICYHNMDNLAEPPEVHTRHLIIDEVQDNSIAEFIYSIKYTDKHQCSLYIVGDCSQTLYEFRASNPKALNVLEGSGVFETHKLETNYRSNQEILDFANILLGTIEANQYANIQLKANSLARVTAQSFKDKVTVVCTRIPNKNAVTIENMLAHSVSVDNRAYIQDKLDKKEQLTILAFKRATLDSIKSHLANVFPNAKVVSIVPDRSRESTIISAFIAKEWENITYTPPASLMLTIRRALSSHILSGANSAGQKVQAKAAMLNNIATGLMDSFENEYGSVIANWQAQVANSVMPVADMLAEVRKLLLGFEIRRNAVAQSITSSRNSANKDSDDVKNADILLSTIHSAKGLEFPHTLVYYGDAKNAGASNLDEPEKRMYYVAFTRAQKSEQIFAFDTLVRPKVLGDYETVVKTLEAEDALWAAQAAADAASNTDADADDADGASGADAVTDGPVAVSGASAQDAGGTGGTEADGHTVPSDPIDPGNGDPA